jgi:DNA-binding CsgD family transcriptional regulator
MNSQEDSSLSSAVLVYSLKGQLLYSNRTARDFIESSHSTRKPSSIRDHNVGLEIQRMCIRLKEQLVGGPKQTELKNRGCGEVPLQVGKHRYRLKGLTIDSSLSAEPCIVVLVEKQRITSTGVDLAAMQMTYKLTNRESQILDLLSKGRSYKEIAYELSISGNTVRDHIKNIRFKIHADSKCGILAKLLEVRTDTELFTSERGIVDAQDGLHDTERKRVRRLSNSIDKARTVKNLALSKGYTSLATL